MRWLSLELPHLALEVFAGAEAAARPLVVTTGHGQRQWVHARNRAAAEAGVGPAMPLATAQALVRDLAVRPRDPAAERAALEGLAAWAGQFTSYLSLAPPAGLLLEAAGSLTLFGGIGPFREAVRAGLEEVGYRARLGIAPTPLGARLLAYAGDPEPVADLPGLERRLAPLPLAALDLEPATLEALRGLGLHRLGDCLELPRSGLTRRLGPALLERLDRALGRRPDPRPAYTPPAGFQRRLPLPAETADSQALLFAARRLLLELAGFLRARRAGIQRLEFRFHPPRGAAERLPVGLVAPDRDPDRLLGLLRTRLERFPLAAPAEALGLVAAAPVPLEEVQSDLFETETSGAGDWGTLIERLQARLGPDAVHGCLAVPDHRPEQAWRTAAPGEGGEIPRFGPRPLWLLEPPRPLNEVRGQPQHHGPLRLLNGPERIEAAWWEADGVARDYYVAEDRNRARLWVFRERRPPGRWFLHGLFA